MQIHPYYASVDFLEEYDSTYDIVFLDIEMPGSDGLTTAREIRGKDDAVAIIFITNMAQYAIHGYEVNAIDFMVKPVGYFNFAQKAGESHAVSSPPQPAHCPAVRGGRRDSPGRL